MNCPDQQLRSALQGYAAELRAEHAPPPAAVIWLAAERRNRRLALSRAARPLWIMQAIAVLAGVAVGGWAIRAADWSFDGRWMTWAPAAMLLVAAGCWTMWRAARSLSV